MTTEVRTITADELGAYGACLGAAFQEQQSPEWATFRRDLPGFDLDRTHAAFEGGVLCGTARSFPTRLRLPGGRAIDAGAVTHVTVRPTHRRRGHLTAMMATQLADIAHRGEPIAILVSAEWPIYGRFGYGPAVGYEALEIDTALASFTDPAAHGTVDLVDDSQLRAIAPEVFERHQEQTPGAISRDPIWWDVVLGVRPQPGWKDDAKRFRVVHHDRSGIADGYATYTSKPRWEYQRASTQVTVTELITTTAGAYRDLWRYLIDLDLVVKVTAPQRPIADPLPLLLHDGRAVRTFERPDHIWTRVLDVPAVLGAGTCSAPGRVVIEVVDHQHGAGGRFVLDGSPDGSTCASTTESADVTMPVATLGATCLGGTSVAALAVAGLVDEHRAGAVDELTRMLITTPPPWCTTNF